MIISAGIQVIAAEGEHKASRALRHAAEIITDNPAALQVFRDFHKIMILNNFILAEISPDSEQYICGE